jgi:acylpyruvate hydrolase
MRLVAYSLGGREGLAVADQNGALFGRLRGEAGFPGSIGELVAKGPSALAEARATLSKGSAVDRKQIKYLPPLANPGKIICLGLNYADHAAEGGFKPPEYPTLFARFASSLIGHEAPLIRPSISAQLDYEGELVAVLGRGGRNISKASALDYVAGYSIFNDGSIRDYQLKTPQWTIGKNFDGSGAFGPDFVTPDELPAGAKGLKLQTRLNGQVMQNASTTDMIFDVATTIALLSEAITLSPGDVLVMGTPAGIGLARKPPVFMKAGDVCEVEIEGLGILRNPIENEPGEQRVAG